MVHELGSLHQDSLVAPYIIVKTPTPLLQAHVLHVVQKSILNYTSSIRIVYTKASPTGHHTILSP